MKILFIGDIVGKPGRKALKYFLENHRDEFDFCIVNGENAAGGRGITPLIAEEIFSLGVDVITTGNHIWDKKEIIPYLNENSRILRPLNYPPSAPGKGWGLFSVNNSTELAVINLSGRVFMPCIDCPFQKVEEIIPEINVRTSCIIVDMHGEATSEKIAMGYFLNGKVSAVVGTHTHVQTSDERIFSCGTAYITDVGMTGSFDSIIGVRKKEVMRHFITQIPFRFKVAEGEVSVNGVWMELDEMTGKALSITRIKERVE